MESSESRAPLKWLHWVIWQGLWDGVWICLFTIAGFWILRSGLGSFGKWNLDLSDPEPWKCASRDSGFEATVHSQNLGIFWKFWNSCGSSWDFLENKFPIEPQKLENSWIFLCKNCKKKLGKPVGNRNFRTARIRWKKGNFRYFSDFFFLQFWEISKTFGKCWKFSKNSGSSLDIKFSILTPDYTSLKRNSPTHWCSRLMWWVKPLAKKGLQTWHNAIH